MLENMDAGTLARVVKFAAGIARRVDREGGTNQ